ncbi:hypothetical protein FC98_GL000671 [Lentilactobacillus kisonensis DSM 19906 = JCM 15041]|nr:hypothetical protein FC98_GL000671 [Lentilactobacillus kisonensis DSM 19906 = JCM 15041]
MLMGGHQDEIDKSVRSIQEKQFAYITRNFTLKLVHFDSSLTGLKNNQEIAKVLASKKEPVPIVSINDKVIKIGKFLSPQELASLFDGFSVQIPNDPDASSD